MVLYHVTTAKLARRYRQQGFIRGPVRGFDTLQGALLWALHVGRKVIYRIDTTERSPVRLLPDHHNAWGNAYWIEGNVPIECIRCVVSAAGRKIRVNY